MRGPKSKVGGDDEFIAEFSRLGAAPLARQYGLTERAVYLRRTRIEKRLGKKIESPFAAGANANPMWRQEPFPGRLTTNIQNGVVVVAGDAHYWPLPPSLMHRALVHFIRQFADERILRMVVMNGDVTDFPRLSSWPVVDWQKQPDVADEIEVCTDRLHEIALAAGRVEKIWTLGNHDARWSIYLARHAKEVQGVKGINLKDHFPAWKACWSLMVNPDQEAVFIKHRGPSVGAKHATSLNPERAGYTIVTNHLHSAQVRPITNMRGTIYGVEVPLICLTWIVS